MIKRPAAAAAVVVIAAVMLGDRWPSASSWAAWAAAAAGLICLVSYLAGRRALSGFFALLCLALLGLGRSAGLAVDHPLQEPFDVQGAPLAASIQGLVIEDSKGLSSPARLLVEVERVTLNGRELPGGHARAALTAFEGKVNARVGDRIIYEGKVKLPTSFKNPGCFDLASFDRRRGIVLLTSVSDGADVRISQEAAGFPLRRALETVRSVVRKRIVAALPGDPGAIMCALILGETVLVNDDVRDIFARSGVAHLLSISGTHIAALAAFIYASVLLIFKARPRWLLKVNAAKVAAIMSIAPVIFYVLLAHGRVPTLRSAIMLGLGALAIISERLRDLPSAVALAAAIILLIWPGSLWEPGFQLSFSAVITMALYYGLMRRLAARRSKLDEIEARKRPAPVLRNVAHMMTLSAALVIGTAPVTAAHFGQVAPAAVLANVPAVPLVGLLVVPLGLIGALVSLIWPDGGAFIFTLAGALIEGLVPFLDLASRLPGSYLLFPAIRPGQALLLVCALLTLSLGRKRRWYLHATLVFLALACLIEVGIRVRDRLDPRLRVEALDVGQGLCLLLRFPHGRAALIDGGGSRLGAVDVGEAAVLPYLKHERISRLDFVLATHPHPDHFLGLMPVIRSIRVDQVLRSRFDQNEQGADERYADFLDLVRERGIPERIVDSTSKDERVGDVRIEFISPPPASENIAGWTLNDKSVAVRVVYQDISFLLGADIEQRAERQLLGSDRPLASTVFLAPHHGSATSSSGPLLQRVHPKYVILSAGRFNSYGLPNRMILDRLAGLGVQIWRTDLNGLVSFATDGRSITVRAQASRAD